MSTYLVIKEKGVHRRRGRHQNTMAGQGSAGGMGAPPWEPGAGVLRERYRKEPWLLTRRMAELEEWDMDTLKDHQRELLLLLDLVWKMEWYVSVISSKNGTEQ